MIYFDILAAAAPDPLQHSLRILRTVRTFARRFKRRRRPPKFAPCCRSGPFPADLYLCRVRRLYRQIRALHGMPLKPQPAGSSAASLVRSVRLLRFNQLKSAIKKGAGSRRSCAPMLFIMLLSVGAASRASCLSLCMLPVFLGSFPPDPFRPLQIFRPAFVNLLQNQPRRLPCW